MERCQYLYDEFKKAMNDLKEQESLQKEIRRVNERADKIFSEWIQDGQRVESYTTTMENEMSGLERSMVRIKASIATMDIQQKASELRRKEELSVVRETVTSVGRDVGNGIQIMKGLFQRVQGVNCHPLKCFTLSTEVSPSQMTTTDFSVFPTLLSVVVRLEGDSRELFKKI